MNLLSNNNVNQELLKTRESSVTKRRRENRRVSELLENLSNVTSSPSVIRLKSVMATSKKILFEDDEQVICGKRSSKKQKISYSELQFVKDYDIQPDEDLLSRDEISSLCKGYKLRKGSPSDNTHLRRQLIRGYQQTNQRISGLETVIKRQSIIKSSRDDKSSSDVNKSNQLNICNNKQKDIENVEYKKSNKLDLYISNKENIENISISIPKIDENVLLKEKLLLQNKDNKYDKVMNLVDDVLGQFDFMGSSKVLKNNSINNRQ
jgi:hypothetical protein